MSASVRALLLAITCFRMAQNQIVDVPQGSCRPSRAVHSPALGEDQAVCRLNSLPFNCDGRVIQSDGIWRVHEFTWQLDAILFGIALKAAGYAAQFHYPERPANLSSLKPLENWPKFDPRNAR
jgi:hypothetical protein